MPGIESFPEVDIEADEILTASSRLATAQVLYSFLEDSGEIAQVRRNFQRWGSGSCRASLGLMGKVA